MTSRLKKILSLRSRISTQIYLGIGGAVALTVAASLVGWFSFNRVGEAQSRVNEGSVPELTASFGVAQYSGALVAAAPRLTSATTPQEFEIVSASVVESQQSFEEQLAVLEQRDAEAESFQRVRTHADSLIFNIEAVKTEMTDYFVLIENREALRTELVNIRSELEDILVPAIDDQLFYTITGYRDLGDPETPLMEHFSEAEFSRYRHLAELLSGTNIATELLANAFTLQDPSLLEPLRERFEAVSGGIERNLAGLKDSIYHDDLEPTFAKLFVLGIGEQSGFNLLERELKLVERQQNLTVLNRDIAIDLVTEVDGLVSTARNSSQVATQASSQAILTGRSLLLSISAISVGGALLIAWLFVGRVLLRRLQRLSDWMQRMAGGDLEASVEIGGRDEIADMAAALEVFRRHALEVQRLNLVEKLAEELQGKNEQMEVVLADLRKAQDQIVMREKLAALGELTAGVAHEIRNPLNFVKNFSEVSGELLEELRETLAEGGDKPLDKEQQSLIQEISEDLNSNLERIRSHGDRANRIVENMLSMGRGSTDRQFTDINHLLDEHARLAYHSARAADPNFQLDLKQEFDPDMGVVQVISQDLGRVFLNMVSNACYATDERRRLAAEAGKEAEPYSPTVWLMTRRGEETAEIRIRDNGTGMPPDVIEKVFNPFFTTKPTDQGTGLGLAISNDIIRRHGGVIKVESEPGQFTEMTIELPLVAPVVSAEDADGKSYTETAP